MDNGDEISNTTTMTIFWWTEFPLYMLIGSSIGRTDLKQFKMLKILNFERIMSWSLILNDFFFSKIFKADLTFFSLSYID